MVVIILYRPPDMNLSSFYDELTDLLSKLGDDVESDQVVICGDFNCTGAVSTAIDDDLQSLFNINGMYQRVTSPTRHSPIAPSNLFDLVVCHAGSTRISSAEVCASHMSHHELIK